MLTILFQKLMLIKKGLQARKGDKESKRVRAVSNGVHEALASAIRDIDEAKQV